MNSGRYETRLIAFLTAVEKLATRYGLKLVKEPEVADAGDPEQDTKPSPYIPDSDLDYHG
jgi:hypothetical protein